MLKPAKYFVLAAVFVFFAGATWAAEKANTYQVTGPVLEKTDTKLVVQKGNDKWEIELDANSNVPPELKVGDKVTVEYRMFATKITIKPATAPKAPAKPKEQAKPK
jgi:hypothetical protein